MGLQLSLEYLVCVGASVRELKPRILSPMAPMPTVKVQSRVVRRKMAR